LSIEEAVTRLEAGAGSQFDPDVTQLFVRHIRAKSYDMVPADPVESGGVST
jgi:HD-GYP domain-containing protein (c-di-GMP phosphodiesterase class II)